ALLPFARSRSAGSAPWSRSIRPTFAQSRSKKHSITSSEFLFARTQWKQPATSGLLSETSQKKRRQVTPASVFLDLSTYRLRFPNFAFISDTCFLLEPVITFS